MAANRIYEDYKMCHLSECKEINQEIHNWFFPVIIPEMPVPKPKRILEQKEPKEKHTPHGQSITICLRDIFLNGYRIIF